MQKRISLEETIFINKNSFLISALTFTPIILLLVLLSYVYYLYINTLLESLNFPLLISSIIAFTGLWLTSFSLLTNSIETRRKTSTDILFSLEKDLEFSKSKRMILSTPDLTFIFFPRPDIDNSYSEFLDNLEDSFYYCTNIYEFLALSIRNSTIDEQIFKSLYSSRFLKFWEKIQPIVEEIRKRESKDSLFEHIEWLADRCKNH